MVKSIDMQQLFTQTKAVERIQQVQQQHPDIQQRYFEDQLRKEKRLSKEKIKASQEIEQLKVGQEERRQKKENKDDGTRSKKNIESSSGDFDSEGIEHEPGEKIDVRV